MDQKNGLVDSDIESNNIKDELNLKDPNIPKTSEPKKKYLLYSYLLAASKRCWIWVLLFPIIFAIAAFWFSKNKIAALYEYSFIISLEKVETPKHLMEESDSRNPFAVIPDLSMRKAAAGIKKTSVITYIEKTFPRAQKSISNDEIFIHKIDTSKKSNTINIILRGGKDRDFKKFAKQVSYKINKTLTVADDNQIEDLTARLKYITEVEKKLESSARKIENALKTYGFSAILVKEKNVIAPRLSYIRGMRIKYRTSLRSISSGTVNLRNTGFISPGPVSPNTILHTILGFLAGIVFSVFFILLIEFKHYYLLIKQLLFADDVAKKDNSSKGVSEVRNTIEINDNKSDQTKPVDISESVFEKYKNLQNEIFLILKTMDKDLVTEIFENWTIEGSEGYKKIALLTSTAFTYDPKIKLHIPENKKIAEAFKSIDKLDFETRFKLLDESFHEISGYVALGPDAFKVLFSSLINLPAQSIYEIINDKPIKIQSLTLSGLTEDKRKEVLDLYDENKKIEIYKEIILLPNSIQKSQLKELEDSLKDDLARIKSQKKSSITGEIETDFIKVNLLNGLPIEIEFFMVTDLLNENPDNIAWFSKHKFSLPLFRFFKDSVIVDLTQNIAPSEFLNIFSIFNKDFLNHVVSLQNSVKKQIIKDELKTHSYEDIDFDSVEKWTDELKKKIEDKLVKNPFNFLDATKVEKLANNIKPKEEKEEAS